MNTFKSVYMTGLLVAGISVLLQPVNSAQTGGIDWVRRFLYQPVSSWADAIVYGR